MVEYSNVEAEHKIKTAEAISKYDKTMEAWTREQACRNVSFRPVRLALYLMALVMVGYTLNLFPW